MTNICTFAPTCVSHSLTEWLATQQSECFSYCSVGAEKEIISIMQSWVQSMNNYIQDLHNNSMIESDQAKQCSISVCNETNMRKEQNLRRLDEISTLQDNWDGYGAKAFSETLIQVCKNIVSALEFQPLIFPTGRRSVQFQYELDDRSYLEFEIFETSVACLQVPQRDYAKAITTEFPASDIERIKEIVKKFYE